MNSLIRFSRNSWRPLWLVFTSPSLSAYWASSLKPTLPFSTCCADARVPRAVAVLDELGQAPVLADRGGNLETAREGVHPADVGVEQIDRLERFPAAFGVEVRPAGGEPAVFQEGQHDLRGQVDVGRELVGVPADEQIARVGVNRTERARGSRHFEVVLHGVPRQRGVVGLDVQFEILEQVIFAQEIQAGRRVGIVLVLGRFLGLGLDVELALEPDALLVVDRQVQERAQVIQLAFHVGVQQGAVTFPPAPEDVARAAEIVGDFDGFLHLRRRVGEHVRVAARGRAVHEPRVARTGRPCPRAARCRSRAGTSSIP